MNHRTAVLDELQQIWNTQGPGAYALADSLRCFVQGDASYLIAIKQLLAEGLILGVPSGVKTPEGEDRTAIALNPAMIQSSAPAPNVINNFAITNNSGVINLQSTLTAVTQSITAAPYLDSATKDRLNALFTEFTRHLEATPADKAEAAQIAAEQAKELTEELAKAKPRESVVRIKGSGLIEATKALASIVPSAVTIAREIVQLIAPAA